ncbi:MAG TPA: phosphohistidine phosphatase SixA [Thermoanaerobaculia bacterium]
MDVWLLRHAKAHDHAPSGRDEDRELTSRGRARAEAVARGLAVLSPDIEIVLTSPFPRARQTAEPCARALGLDPPREFRALLPGMDPSRVAKELAREGWESALLVGHQPLLGSLIGFLVFGDEGREIPLRKASIAHVSWHPGSSGHLEALFPPEALERLGSSKPESV